MTAQEVLAAVKSAGVVVRVVDGELRARRMGGGVPEEMAELLRQHRDRVMAYICAQALEERWGKAPAPADSPPMRAVKALLTDRQRRLGIAYVLRQPRGGVLPRATYPLEWVWARTEEYRAWARAQWAEHEIADAALLDFLCWQRRMNDYQATEWLECMDDAWADVRMLEKTRADALTEREIECEK